MFKTIQNRTVLCSNSTIIVSLILLINLNTSCSNRKERPSPLRTDSTQIGNIQLKLEYSSPGVKNRDIFGIGSGYLVPYKELWRTGANQSSSISFDKPMLIDSAYIPKGKYSIFTIPDAKTWIVILNKDAEQWGSYYYQDSLDVYRTRIKIKKKDKLQERMKLYFHQDSLKFSWEYVNWSIPIANP